MTEEKKQQLEKPVVLYDASCRFCVTAADQMRELDKNGDIEWLDKDDPDVQKRFQGVDWDRADEEIHFIHTDGKITVGSRAVADIAETIGGDVGRTAARAMKLPGVKEASDLIYKVVSENRHRIMGEKS